MSVFMLAVLILSGPPQPSGATIPLRIHLGRDWRSNVAKHELECRHEWFWAKRLRIEASYRIVVDDDASDFPTWEIGRNQERQRFLAGSFSGSGAFLCALESIAAIDRWERDNPFLEGSMWADEEYMTDWQRRALIKHRETRPEIFPPELPVEGER